MSRSLLLAFPLLLAGCYDQPFSENFGATTPNVERKPAANAARVETETPVRIGEQGPSFPACAAQGRVQARDGLAVRTAPFDRAREIATLPRDATVFICSRSMDQHWLGIVYEAPGNASEACGVTVPSSRRQDYDGACASGWVPSAQVRMLAGVGRGPEQPAGNAAAPNSANGAATSAK